MAGQITINAKNIIGNASGTIQNDAKTIKNSAGTKFTQNGKKGVNNDKNEKRKPVAKLITKVEGPFDEKNIKVAKIKLGVFYKYSATLSRKPTDAEVKMIRWSHKLDDAKIEEFNGAPSSNSLSGQKVTINLRLFKDFKKGRIYAFLDKPDEKHSVIIKPNVVTLPILIGYSFGFNNNNRFPALLNPAVKNISLKQNDTVSGASVTGITEPGLETYATTTEKVLAERLTNLIMNRVNDDNKDMSAVAQAIVNQFLAKGGGVYHHPLLDSFVTKDTNFISFDKAFSYKIYKKLKKINNDLTQVVPNDLVRFDNFAFNTFANNYDGLAILIHAIEHIEVFIEEYKVLSASSVSFKLKYIIYDTFGLDIEDLRRFGKRTGADITLSNDRLVRANGGEAFSAWWLLQNKFGCKSVQTQIIITMPAKIYDKTTVYTHPNDPKKNTSNDTNYNIPPK